MASGEADDLWDFGTVRHVGTMGRSMDTSGGDGLGSIPAARSSMEYVGPGSGSTSVSRPGMNGRTGTTSSSGSGSSNLPSAANITIKGDLPPGLSSGAGRYGDPPGKYADPNARYGDSPPRGGTLRAVGNAGFGDADEDEDDTVAGPSGVAGGDDYEARVMLDSVVLPAITSVSLEFALVLGGVVLIIVLGDSCSLVCRVTLMSH